LLVRVNRHAGHCSVHKYRSACSAAKEHALLRHLAWQLRKKLCSQLPTLFNSIALEKLLPFDEATALESVLRALARRCTYLFDALLRYAACRAVASPQQADGFPGAGGRHGQA